MTIGKRGTKEADGLGSSFWTITAQLITNSAHYNGEHDGHDANANCDNDLWSNNYLDWVNQARVSPSAGVR
ncbi:MAG TPA: hypothetical protein VMZ51_06520 [Acidimicrobiales bacterium]|nr:hypothetical protein [Acidimicrobiales bacterium]